MVDTSANALADPELDEAPSRVVPLSELEEFEIADGYPEIRGWDVRDAADRSIGYVYDLLVDVASMRVRYLDVMLDAQFAETDADQRVLIPIEPVSLDAGNDGVRLEGIDAAEVRALVPYARRGIARDREAIVTPPAAVADADAPAQGAAALADSELRREPQYDDERLFRDRAPAAPPPVAPTAQAEGGLLRAEEAVSVTARPVKVGEVAVRTVVETEDVRERVPVTREDVEIERRPLRPGEELRAVDTQGDEIRIPIMVEEVVIEKRLVAKEVLIIRKRTITEEQTVETEVRRERVEVDDPLGRVRQAGGSDNPIEGVRSIAPSGGPEGGA